MKKIFWQIPTLFQQKRARVLLAVALVALCLGFLSIGIRSLTRENTLGSDFYVFYLAGKTIQNHENPYSSELAQQAQLSIYKRLAQPGEDELGFAYPPYAILPVIPLLFLNFEDAQAVWMAICILLLISSIYISAPRIPLWIMFSVLFLYPISCGLILGNFAIPITAILLIEYSFVTATQTPGKRSQLLLGVLLAWITCKPQFSGLFVIILLLFSIQRRQKWLVISFLTGAFSFILLSFLLLPGWPGFLAEQITRYTQYNNTWMMITFLAMQLFQLETSILVSILGLVIFLLVTFWFLKKWKQGKISNLIFFSWAALLTFLIHPRGKSYEQIIYLIPMILWIASYCDPKSWKVNLFWFSNLGFLAATFFFSTLPNKPDSLIEWPLAVFILWFGWLLIKNQGKIPVTKLDGGGLRL